MLLLLAAPLLLVGANPHKARRRPPPPPMWHCLDLLSATTTCEQRLVSLVPHDRYTCRNLTDILRCADEAARRGCYGVSADQRSSRDRVTARLLFPTHPCAELDVSMEQVVREYETDDVAR